MNDEDETYVTKRTIESLFNMTGGGLDYALKIKVFNDYYNSKEG